MAESIETPFGLWAWMGPRNYIVDGGPVGPETSWHRGSSSLADTAYIGRKRQYFISSVSRICYQQFYCWFIVRGVADVLYTSVCICHMMIRCAPSLSGT